MVKKIKSVLESVGTRLQAALDEKGLDAKSILIIDDEADYASVNTNRPGAEPTSTNKLIRAIFNKFPIASYVGYTATPFANVFINPDDEEGNGVYAQLTKYQLKEIGRITTLLAENGIE